MRNFIQRGQILDLTAPSGGLVSGQGVIIGSIFGVATVDATEGETLAVQVEGVFSLPKVAGALTEGALAYWTPGGNITGTASGNTLVGHVVANAASGDATALVRLSN